MVQNVRTVEAGPQDKEAEKRSSIGTGVVCIGRVDVESGLVPLRPLQPGAIVDLYCFEGQQVKKGDLLLKVDEAPFRHKLAEADEAVAMAETVLSQAKQGLERFPEVVAQQEAAVRAATAKLKAAQAQFERVEKLLKLNIPQISNEEVRAAREGIRGLEENLNAEEAKLREVEKSKPEEKVNEAKKAIEIRKRQVDQAREAVERCTLAAPQDGTILQMLGTVGSQYGPQSHHPTLILAPNGPRIIRLEVDQEFAGRITVGATASIQDEANVGPTWTGKVIRIADAYLPKRPASSGPEIMTTNGETRCLEVIVSIEPAPTMPRLGQRMRASIGQTALSAGSRPTS
jgi:multidrug resistance efflux pump